MGTAMGTKFAPNYATLVLGYLEIKFYEKLKNRFTDTIAEKVKTNFLRYLDDIFFIWDKNDGNVIEVRNLLNSLDSQLSFTCDQIGSRVTFLDVVVISENSEITTDIYYKPTDTKRYLNYHSNHPRHVKNNIPYNLARRICSIVVRPNLLSLRLAELKQNLVRCNYPAKLVEVGINKALSIPLNEIRAAKEIESNETELPFITTYNPNYSNNFGAAKNVVEFLKECPGLEPVFNKTEVIKSNRQPPNLKNILTKARLHTSENYTVTKCGDKRCKLCTEIIEGCSFNFEKNYSFRVNCNMNCSTLNCIYVIRCAGCSKLYIGETNNFRLRTNLHRDHVTNNRGLHVSKHIYECTKLKSKKFDIMPFYKVKRDCESLRKQKETYFINKFKPDLNK